MILRKVHDDFSHDFLERHLDIILQDTFHHIQSYFIHPPHCACSDSCPCEELRKSIALTLNLDLYNHMEQAGCEEHYLYAMRYLMQIPNDSSFKKLHTTAYPIWLIKERLAENEEKNHFKIVEHLVMTLLRLGITYDLAFNEPRASIKEAVEIILGNMPL